MDPAYLGMHAPAVLTASPLHWDSLLKHRPSQALSSFAPNAPSTALVGQHRHPGPLGIAFNGKAARPKHAEVQAVIRSIAAEMLGSTVDPDLPLMEVG